MDRMKTFLIYTLLVVGFIIFSELLINISLETSYANLGRKDNLKQVTIYQAQATKVNGRIKGTIFNDENDKIKDRYLKIDLYSERDVLLGSKYIDLLGIRDNETRNLEVYFKLQDVDYYELSFVEEKGPEEELPEMVKDLTKGEILVITLFTYLMFV